MNFELKLALLKAGRPAWRVAVEAGLTPTTLSRIVQGRRVASDAERSNLARALQRPVAELFPAIINEAKAA